MPRNPVIDAVCSSIGSSVWVLANVPMTPVGLYRATRDSAPAHSAGAAKHGEHRSAAEQQAAEDQGEQREHDGAARRHGQADGDRFVVGVGEEAPFVDGAQEVAEERHQRPPRSPTRAAP